MSDGDAPPPGPPRPRILILDDDQLSLDLLRRMLETLGFAEVACCDNGGAALERVGAAAGAPDVILCDLNMPQMDGIEFVRALVQRGYRGALVMVSGENERLLAMVERLVQAQGIAVLGSLRKPPLPATLAGLLARWTPYLAARPRAAQEGYSAGEVAAAIANDELVNHYQPKVSVATGEVVGVETLVRWSHPRDGMVFPDRFVGVAEASGLIGELTRVVLGNALRQTKAWQDAGLPLCVAVNVSVENLSALGFADDVDGLAARIGVAPKDIVLEVTESRLMNDLPVALDVLTRLRLKRFRLSIDDFGTGYSSLGQLRDIPFDELKVDRSFVHGAGTDRTVRAIFDASLGLARQLGLEIVAEGVENREDWDVLRRAGCDVAQGYFVGRPMPAEALPGWVSEWKRRVRDGLIGDTGPL